MPNHRSFKNTPDAELYKLIVELEEELETPGLDHAFLSKQLALVEDELEAREWD